MSPDDDSARRGPVLAPLGVEHAPPTLADQAYISILQAIFGASFRPGDHLSVPALSRELGISRSPVREAILRLEEDGLVETIPRRGAVVVGVSVVELIKLYEVREVLEGLAARLAATHATETQLDELTSTFEKHREAVEADDIDAHMAIDLDFHDLLFEAGENHYVTSMRREIQNQIRLGLVSTAALPGNISKALEEHEAILRAVTARDPERAEHAARAHIRRIIGSLGHVAETLQT